MVNQKKRDYYDVLGISKGADDDLVRKAYRKLARKYHPDFNEGDKAAEDKFKEVSEAYAVLSNKEARQIYDQFGHGGSPNFEGFDFSGFDFSNFSGSFSGGGKTYDAGGFDLSDLFEGIFGGRSRSSPFRQHRGRPMRGQNLRVVMDIDFVDAALGTTTQIALDTGGATTRLTVRIPPGVDHGQVIRLKGKGSPNPHGGPPGDLLIEARIRPHPQFTRKGLNLYCKKSISFSLAALGGKIDVPTLEEKPISMTLPEGTQGGQTFRLQKKGIRKKNGQTGDLYCTVQIAVPKNLDEQSRELIEQFERRNRTTAG